ncbi:hypothetical protein YPPY103_2669, partial [Yersinia pestis PY-103]
MAEKH